MSRFLLIFYLACLGSLSSRVTAQGCNSTGTYDSCCQSPSSDKKAVTFQGKEYRVHCDSAIIQDKTYLKTPADCANGCSSQANCVDAHWSPPKPGYRIGECETRNIGVEAKRVAFVWLDPTDKIACGKDLDKCKTDLNNCKPGDPTCPGKLTQCQTDLNNCKPGDPTCPGKLTQCQTDLNNCKPGDPACPGRLQQCQTDLNNCKPGDPACPGRLQQCQTDLNNCKPGDPKCPGALRRCQGDKTKCLRDLAACRKRPVVDPNKKKPGPFICIEGNVEKIGGANYRHHCKQVQTWPRTNQLQVEARDERDCARQCTQRGCKFAMFVNAKACYVHSFEWRSDATAAHDAGYTVLQRVP